VERDLSQPPDQLYAVFIFCVASELSGVHVLPAAVAYVTAVSPTDTPLLFVDGAYRKVNHTQHPARVCVSTADSRFRHLYHGLMQPEDCMTTSHKSDIWQTSVTKQRLVDRIPVVTNNRNNKGSIVIGVNWFPVWRRVRIPPL
jgi:hypothetical protein